MLGVKEVFINRGSKGTCYGNIDGIFFYNREPYKMANSNGAGDAFMAGLVYSSLNDMNVHQKVKFASAASALTVLCNETVNPSLSTEKNTRNNRITGVYRQMENNISSYIKIKEEVKTSSGQRADRFSVLNQLLYPTVCHIRIMLKQH